MRQYLLHHELLGSIGGTVAGVDTAAEVTMIALVGMAAAVTAGAVGGAV